MKLDKLKKAGAMFGLYAATAIAAPAQTFTKLADFDGTNGTGALWNMSLIQGADGSLYGTSPYGGTNYGTVYSMTRAGVVTALHKFGFSDGVQPIGGLIRANDGNFYGTTCCGGAYNYGTIFKMTPEGGLTTLYSFCPVAGCTDGAYPYGALVQGTDGNFYGTTYSGGNTNRCGGTEGGCGTVFKITPSGALTTLHSFAGAFGDGANPYAGLIQGIDGSFYGTTESGGYYCIGGCGTVFKITSGGKLTILHEFGGDGAYPYGGLVQAPDGNFYGTTESGTVFKITPSGTLTTLGNPGNSYAGLVLGTDGNLYGTTAAYIGGTLFRITSRGELTTLHTFCTQNDCVDGSTPYGGLVQATDGILYGTT